MIAFETLTENSKEKRLLMENIGLEGRIILKGGIR